MSFKLIVVGQHDTPLTPRLKTTFIYFVKHGRYPEDGYFPTVIDNFTIENQISGHKHIASVYDVSSSPEIYNHMVKMTYPDTHIALVLFSVLSPTEFLHFIPVEVSNIKKESPKAKIFLVGTETQYRDEEKFKAIVQEKLPGVQTIPKHVGAAMSKALHVEGYFECQLGEFTTTAPGEIINESVVEYVTKSHTSKHLVSFQKHGSEDELHSLLQFINTAYPASLDQVTVQMQLFSSDVQFPQEQLSIIAQILRSPAVNLVSEHEKAVAVGFKRNTKKPHFVPIEIALKRTVKEAEVAAILYQLITLSAPGGEVLNFEHPRFTQYDAKWKSFLEACATNDIPKVKDAEEKPMKEMLVAELEATLKAPNTMTSISLSSTFSL